ncbi:MAG TPA: hypothetical protein VFJ82_01575 [Longimicrobium sp.]|nr:hypothetical protein [Longimicrobium sp.]
MAWAIFGGLALLAAAILYIGHGWLALERQDRVGDAADPELDDEVMERIAAVGGDGAARGVRAAASHAAWEKRAWEGEQRADGRSEAQIARELAERPVLFRL